MKINVSAVECRLAEKSLNFSDLRKQGFSPSTIAKFKKEHEVLPKTAGKLADFLNVPVSEIMQRD